MPSILSKLIPWRKISLKYNCYEVGHTWTPYCSEAAIDMGYFAFSEAIKMYTPFYILSQISSGKYDLQTTKRTIKSILRSSFFLGFNSFITLLAFCIGNKQLGKLYMSLSGHVPTIIGSLMAIYIERPSRRSALALYVTNIAVETIFQMAVTKGYIKPLPNGETILFTISMTCLMYYIKKHGFGSDIPSLLLKNILGPYEARQRTKSKKDNLQNKYKVNQNGTIKTNSLNQLNLSQSFLLPSAQNISDTEFLEKKRYSLSSKIKKFFTSKHESCLHPKSCANYVIESLTKSFIFGYLGISLIETVFKYKQLNKNLSLIFNIIKSKKNIRFGLFLAAFSSVYRLTNCFLRLGCNGSYDWHSGLAGFLASPAMMFYPDKTIAQTFFWKSVETFYIECVKSGKIRHIDLTVNLIYAVSVAQLFFVAVLSPSHMRPSYLKFLDSASHHALHLLNRNVIDLLGTQSSAGFELFYPDLDPRYTSRQFKESVLIWSIN